MKAKVPLIRTHHTQARSLFELSQEPLDWLANVQSDGIVAVRWDNARDALTWWSYLPVRDGGVPWLMPAATRGDIAADGSFAQPRPADVVLLVFADRPTAARVVRGGQKSFSDIALRTYWARSIDEALRVRDVMLALRDDAQLKIHPF